MQDVGEFPKFFANLSQEKIDQKTYRLAKILDQLQGNVVTL